MQVEEKWIKARVPDEVKLPDQATDPKGYKKAIEQGRTRLRLRLKDVKSFDFLLTQADVLKNLKKSSWSKVEDNQEVTAHIYYVREKRGYIQDFLTEKWKPHLSDVIVDYGDIRKNENLNDKLSAAIARIQDNINEDNQAEEPENPKPQAERKNKKKRKKDSRESSPIMKKDVKDLKKVKKQEEEKQLLEKRVQNAEHQLQILSTLTRKLIGKWPLEEKASLKQDLDETLLALQQVDSGLAISIPDPNDCFEFFNKIFEEKEAQVSLQQPLKSSSKGSSKIAPEDQVTLIKEMEKIFQESDQTSSFYNSSKGSPNQELITSKIVREGEEIINIEPRIEEKAEDVKEEGGREQAENKPRTADKKEGKFLTKAQTQSLTPLAKKGNKKECRNIEDAPASARKTIEEVVKHMQKTKKSAHELMQDKATTNGAWQSVLNNYPLIFEDKNIFKLF